jgi:hypothetical protein
VPLFQQTPLGRRSEPSEFEALREGVHRFDEYQGTIFRSTRNRLCCSAAMQEAQGYFAASEVPSQGLGVGKHIQKRPRHQRA